MLPSPRHHSIDQRRHKTRLWRGRIGLCLVAALSLLAGATDAVGFMATGDFVSFMSGNTTRLAVAVSNGDWALVLRLAMLLAAFVASNASGVVLARLGRRRALPLLLCVATLLCLAAALPMTEQFFALLAAVAAMGILNAAVEQVNGLPIGLTYVTGALSRFGRGLGRRLLGEHNDGWRVQLIPWAGMCIGAVIGAALEQRMGMQAMWVNGLFAIALGLVSMRIPRRWQLGYMPR